MDKQIEELAKFLCKNASPCSLVVWEDCERKGDCGRVSKQAKVLVEAGYRKIPENAVVLTREEYKKLKRRHELCKTCVEIADAMVKKVRKETAEKFAERLKSEKYLLYGATNEIKICNIRHELIDEIAKELGVDNG